jgi:hypothetical protein
MNSLILETEANFQIFKDHFDFVVKGMRERGLPL